MENEKLSHWNPMQLIIMLEIYAGKKISFPDSHLRSEYLNDLLAHGLILKENVPLKSMGVEFIASNNYICTEHGKAFVSLICHARVPIEERNFVDQHGNRIPKL